MDPVQLSPPAMLQPMEQLQPRSVFAGMCAASARDSRFAVAMYVAPDVQDANAVGAARRSDPEDAPPTAAARFFQMGDREMVGLCWVYHALVQEWFRLNWYRPSKRTVVWKAKGLEWDSIVAGKGTWQYEAVQIFEFWWGVIPGI